MRIELSRSAVPSRSAGEGARLGELNPHVVHPVPRATIRLPAEEPTPRGERAILAALPVELRELVPTMPPEARAWVLAHPEEAARRYAARAAAVSLYNRFGERGAPRPGERGYKPPAAHSPGSAMLAQTYANLTDPMFYAGWAALAEEAEWSDEEEHEELISDFLDFYVGVPDVAPDGRAYTFEDRAYIALWMTDLAMLAHPEMHDGTHWTGAETYLQHKPEGEPLPYWLASALADDAFQTDVDLRLINVPLSRACEFVAEHHSKLPRCNPRGLMYAIGVLRGRRLVAVATAGSPTGRWGKGRVDPRDVLELTRVASDGTVKGASSKLVSRVLDLLPRSGRGTGPQLFVTYSLASEPGTTYRALADKGLRPVERIRGKAAAGGARGGSGGALQEADKIRWEAGPAALPARWDLLRAAS